MFNSIKAVKEVVSSLPNAYSAPIEAEGIKIPNKKAIINEETKRVSSIVSDIYKIVNHQEFFLPILDSLTGQEKVSLQVRENKDSVAMNVILPDLNIKDDTDEGISVGFRAMNSYDTSSMFGVQLFFFREYCENGMVISKKIANSYAKHTVNNTLEFKFQDVISDITSQLPTIQSKINQKMELTFSSTDEMREVIEKMFGKINTDKMNSSIPTQIFIEAMNEIKGNLPTHWNLYNGITSVISETLSYHYENKLHKQASKFLLS